MPEWRIDREACMDRGWVEHYDGHGCNSATYGGVNRRHIRAERSGNNAKANYLFSDWVSRVNRRAWCLLDQFAMSCDSQDQIRSAFYSWSNETAEDPGEYFDKFEVTFLLPDGED